MMDDISFKHLIIIAVWNIFIDIFKGCKNGYKSKGFIRHSEMFIVSTFGYVRLKELLVVPYTFTLPSQKG